MEENGFSCSSLALPQHPRTFHEISDTHCVFSCPCELRWDHDLKVCGNQDKAALFIQVKENTVLCSEGLQSWAPCQRWPRNLAFGNTLLGGYELHYSPQPVPCYSPCLPVVFTHEAPWESVAGCHSFSPYRPAARCWLVTGGHVKWPKGQLLSDCPFARLSFGQRTASGRLFLKSHPAKIKWSLKPLLELRFEESNLATSCCR